jgi:methionyl-tRNA formyltransferase
MRMITTGIIKLLRGFKMRICVAGQNNIAVYFAEFLIACKFEIIGCTNKNDLGINNFHRSFLSYCKQKNIVVKKLSQLYNYDDLIFISTEFDQIIDPLKFKSKKLYNIHFSFLPEYKGMYTSALPILHGKNYSGVSLHEIDSGIDTGKIIDQEMFSIEKLTCLQLYNLYTVRGLELLKRNLYKIIFDIYDSSHQNNFGSSYFSRKSIDYSNLIINLNCTAYQIDCQLRAFFFPSKQVPEIYGKKVFNSEILTSRSSGRPGNIVFENEYFLVLDTIDYHLKVYFYRIDELFKAAEIGDIQKVIGFYECGYDIKIRDMNGCDLLLTAAEYGQLSLVKYLVEVVGWNVNTFNNDGKTFLMFALTYSSLTNDFSLLMYALNIKNISLIVTDFYGLGLIDYAIKYENHSIIEILNSL